MQTHNVHSFVHFVHRAALYILAAVVQEKPTVQNLSLYLLPIRQYLSDLTITIGIMAIEQL